MGFIVVRKRDRLIPSKEGEKKSVNLEDEKKSVKQESEKKNIKQESEKKSIKQADERSIQSDKKSTKHDKKSGPLHLFCDTGKVVSIWYSANTLVEKPFLFFLSSKLKHPPTIPDRQQYFLAHASAPNEPIPLDKPIGDCHFSPNEMVLRSFFSHLPPSCS